MMEQKNPDVCALSLFLLLALTLFQLLPATPDLAAGSERPRTYLSDHIYLPDLCFEAQAAHTDSREREIMADFRVREDRRPELNARSFTRRFTRYSSDYRDETERES